MSKTSSGSPSGPKTHHIADKMFKSAMQVRENAVALLQNFVDPVLTAKINFDKLTLDDTAYINKRFKAHYSDVVYRTTWKEEEVEIFIALLWEHKSQPSLHIYLQHLNYMLGIWTRDIQNKKPLAVVIPLVFYQGEKAWETRLFRSYFDHLPVELERFIPQFDYVMTAVREISLEKILGLPKGMFLRRLMLTYKKAADKAYVKKNVGEFIELTDEDLSDDHLYAIFVEYFLEITDLSESEIAELLDQIHSTTMKAKVMSTADHLRAAGRLEGKREGILEGMLEGMLEGKREGILEGKREGELKEKLEVAKSMWLLDQPVEIIAAGYQGLCRESTRMDRRV